MKRFCQTLQLRPDPKLIEAYKQAHAAIWPEIAEGIRSVGILDMQIYLHGTTLFMIVDVPDDFDWDRQMALLATLPRQQEWEDFVGRYQASAPGSTSDQKWQMMTQIFQL